MSNKTNIGINEQVVALATESKTANAILQTSMEFATALDVQQQSRIVELSNNKDEIANLKVDRERLNIQLDNLKITEDQVIIVESDGYGRRQRVVRNLDDSRVKDLLDESLRQDIQDLKDKNYTLQNTIESKEGSIRALHLRIDELRDRIKSVERNHSSELLLKDDNFRKMELKNNLDYQKFKEQYAESLNQLDIDNSIIGMRLQRLKNAMLKLQKNWILRKFTKNLNKLIWDIGNFKYKTSSLVAMKGL